MPRPRRGGYTASGARATPKKCASVADGSVEPARQQCSAERTLRCGPCGHASRRGCRTDRRVYARAPSAWIGHATRLMGSTNDLAADTPASRLDQVLQWVPRILSSKPHVIALLGLGIYLILLPLLGVTVSANAELIGGNYTNVTSDIAASIAAGGTLHLVHQNRKRRKIDEERLQLERETPPAAAPRLQRRGPATRPRRHRRAGRRTARIRPARPARARHRRDLTANGRGFPQPLQPRRRLNTAA